MTDLLVSMIERVGIIVTVAFLLTRFNFFQEMIHQDKLNRNQEYFAILFFGMFGILSSYFGVAYNTDTLNFNSVAQELASDEAIANSRVIGIVIAGLLGGYKVGIGAGLIAGIHRFTLGGFTSLACGSATILSGVIAGIFHKKGKQVKIKTAFGIGALAEAIQMGIILLVSKPFEKALLLVDTIGFPMIIANGLGTAIFLLIIQNVMSEKEKTSARLAQKTLRIADQTLGYLRKGMGDYSASTVCDILYKEIDPAAVAMTDKTHILAHVGEASDHHQSGKPVQTKVTKEVIEEGKLIVVDESIHCKNKDCPLHVAVIAPLKQREETIGTLKLYFHSKKEITDVSIELISGLSSLLSNQLEIAEADRAYQLGKEAEIKALQAQISPHFLFNSINTIVSLVRLDPQKARKLLISLSHFLRQNLAGTTADLVTLEQELAHVRAYMEIEEARFFDKLDIHYEIDEGILNEKIPPLTLQPLVENAMKHGIKEMEKNCIVKIKILKKGQDIKVAVEDNGKGIELEKINQLGKNHLMSESGAGMGLYNVNRRLVMTFGKIASLSINSQDGGGTHVSFQIPREGGISDAENKRLSS